MKNHLSRKFNRKPNLKIIIGIILLIVIIIAVIKFAGTKEKTIAMNAKAVLTITSSVAKTVTWPEVVKASGAIAPWQEAIIGSEISGQRLIEVNVNVGDKVKKGQILARFNPDILKAEQAELLANWQKANSDWQRALSLKNSGALSISQIETFHNEEQVAKARLDAKNLQLHYTDIVAPDDGVISARSATIGKIGNIGEELFRLILKEHIEWRGELNAQQLSNIQPGQKVDLLLPNGNAAKAIVRQTSPSFDNQTRMAIVYADITDCTYAMAGMYAEGTILLNNSEAIIVPAISVIIRDGHNYVFKLQDNKDLTQISMQEVVTGRNQKDEVEIISGLKAGDLIATEGAGFLNDGDKVRLAPSEGDNK